MAVIHVVDGQVFQLRDEHRSAGKYGTRTAGRLPMRFWLI